MTPFRKRNINETNQDARLNSLQKANDFQDDWRRGSFQDFSWKKTFLMNANYAERDGVIKISTAEELGKAILAQYVKTSLSPKTLRIAMPTGFGKVSDAGYDNVACYYTELPSDCDVVVSAKFKGRVRLKKRTPTFQESFGFFMRDTITPEPSSGQFYSNMAAVGGFYGRGNFFGRTGITSESFEEVKNFSFYPKSENLDQHVAFTRKQTYFATLGHNRFGVCAELEDWRGKSMLCERVPRRNDVFYREGKRVWLRTPERLFQEVDPKKIYLGFFVSRGAEIEVDLNSVKIFWKKRTIERPRSLTVYAAPDGTPFGDGTRERPYDLQSAILQCEAGGEVRMTPGVYRPQGDVLVAKNLSGSATLRKKIVGVQDGKNVPVVDFEGKDYALRVEGDFWDIDGIHVTGGCGIVLQGSCNVVRNCRTYRNYETGIMIRHADINAPKEAWPSRNRVVDCVSYCNADRSERNADGFACKVAAGEGNVFENCLSFLNTDDGFDLFAKNRRIGATKIKNCQSFLNGYRLKKNGAIVKTAGNGNGFKLGGSGLAIGHTAENCTALGNKGSGFSSNSNPELRLFSCVSKNNGRLNIEFYYHAPQATPVKIAENCETGSDADFDPVKTAARLLEKVAVS